MKKNKVLMIVLFILAMVIGVQPVYADSPGCAAKIVDAKEYRVGDVFTYEFGTEGVLPYKDNYIYNFFYRILYDATTLEVVEKNGEMDAGIYKNWVRGNYYITDYGDAKAVVISASSPNREDRSAVYDNSSESFMMGYIKFKVIDATKGKTSIEIIKDESFFTVNDEDYGPNDRHCDRNIITVNLNGKDTNTSLSSLTIDNGELSPKFNASTTSYSATVNNEADTIQIDASCAGTNCRVEGAGLKRLSVGDNRFTIKVTAESGDTKNYSLKVTRREKDEVYLQRLSVQGYDLFPSFNSGVANYMVNVPNEVSKLELEYLSNNDNENEITVTGNEDLKVGQNHITISVKNKDKNIEQTYELLVIKAEAKEEVKEETKDSNINIFMIVSIVLGIIALIELFLILKKKDNEEQIKED